MESVHWQWVCTFAWSQYAPKAWLTDERRPLHVESYLAGHLDVVVPGLGASALLMLACLALYGFVRRVDAEVKRTRLRDKL